MASTSEEGSALLKEEGFKGGKKDRETRAQKRTRETVDTILKPDAKKETEMTGEELEKYKESLQMVFRLFDANKDGKVNEAELSAAFISLGMRPTKEKIHAIFASADKDKSGNLSRDEFVEYMVNKQKLKAKKEEVASPKKKSKPAPKKRASPAAKKAAAAPKASAQEAAAPQAPQENQEAAPPRDNLQRGLSITQYFTPFAGLHDEISPSALDAHNNPSGRSYDLGRENAFNIFEILFYNCCTMKDHPNVNTQWDESKKALESKGFRVHIVHNEKDFLDQLENFDEAWICASPRQPADPKRFKEVITNYHKSGRGLFLWTDNDPFYGEVNFILKELIGTTLTGNTPGDKILKVGDGKVSGQFARHLITTGIVNLYEGITISYPTNTDNIKVIAMSTDYHPCIFYTDPAPEKGPIVVDCGFTKLYPRYWSATAGTERYVRNVAVWLLALDYRMMVGSPWKGPVLPAPEEKSGKGEESTSTSTEKTTEE
eukprot:TRINITY_DN1848_c0_g1_i5.p1 TRINITY_DN1848_c0_g1~~TRINITY_DN1848_c0_g1_i5.p1  ORF type:complete len:524 (+),score=178.29 TRINITY_DN1848_c0_g1_i5:110-1573(+)